MICCLFSLATIRFCLFANYLPNSPVDVVCFAIFSLTLFCCFFHLPFLFRNTHAWNEILSCCISRYRVKYAFNILCTIFAKDLVEFDSNFVRFAFANEYRKLYSKLIFSSEKECVLRVIDASFCNWKLPGASRKWSVLHISTFYGGLWFSNDISNYSLSVRRSRSRISMSYLHICCVWLLLVCVDYCVCVHRPQS